MRPCWGWRLACTTTKITLGDELGVFAKGEDTLICQVRQSVDRQLSNEKGFQSKDKYDRVCRMWKHQLHLTSVTILQISYYRCDYKITQSRKVEVYSGYFCR